MVFDYNKKNYNYVPHYKCLNCGNPIENPHGSIEARRFCSAKCRDDYLQTNK